MRIIYAAGKKFETINPQWVNNHESFSFESKLLSEISRRPEHVAISNGYVKKDYGRANL